MQRTPLFKYINIVPFRSITNWGVAFALGNTLDYKHNLKLAKIGKLIQRNKDRIAIEDDVIYRRVTIKLYGKGVLQRDEIKGNTIGTKNQFVISEGQFIMSKIDARNGAFGIVPGDLTGAIVTQDFLAYDINTSLVVPEFFLLLTSTDKFLNLCQQASSGTTGRQRINEEAFLNFEIAVPTIKEQKAWLRVYDQKINLAKQQEEEANTIESKKEPFFFQQLGIVNTQPKVNLKSGKLSTLQFKDIDKWSLTNLLKEKNISFSTSKFDRIEIKKLLLSIEGGKTPSTSRTEYWNGRINWVSPKDFKGLEISSSEDKITDLAVSNAGMKVFKAGVILGVFRSGILRHSFPVALTTIPVTINQDLKAMMVNENLINKHFLLYYLNLMQKFVLEKCSKVGVTVESVNTQEFLTVPVVVPPMKKQIEIVNHIEQLNYKIGVLRNEANQNKMAAMKTFEQSIFTN